MILVCYDGSADAQAAIETAGRLFGDRPATILTVWEIFAEVLPYAGAGLGMGAVAMDYAEIDAALQKAARERAEDGVARAREAGLRAEPCAVASRGTIGATVLAVAREVDAEVIVVGTRGLRRLKSALLGSVSQAVLHHADRPVIVIPSPELAAERAERAD